MSIMDQVCRLVASAVKQRARSAFVRRDSANFRVLNFAGFSAGARRLNPTTILRTRNYAGQAEVRGYFLQPPVSAAMADRLFQRVNGRVRLALLCAENTSSLLPLAQPQWRCTVKERHLFDQEPP